MGADVKANTGGGGALQLLDLRLLEDGVERRGALDSDVVAVEPAGEERSEDGEISALSRGPLTHLLSHLSTLCSSFHSLGYNGLSDEALQALQEAAGSLCLIKDHD